MITFTIIMLFTTPMICLCLGNESGEARVIRSPRRNNSRKSLSPPSNYLINILNALEVLLAVAYEENERFAKDAAAYYNSEKINYNNLTQVMRELRTTRGSRRTFEVMLPVILQVATMVAGSLKMLLDAAPPIKILANPSVDALIELAPPQAMEQMEEEKEEEAPKKVMKKVKKKGKTGPKGALGVALGGGGMVDVGNFGLGVNKHLGLKVVQT